PDDIRSYIRDNRDLIMEIDHHTGADSSYAGNPEFALVDDASSACELIGEIALALEEKIFLREKYGMFILTRNLVLALLTGIIGDSKGGKYLKSDKEKKSYGLFSSMY